MNSLVEIVLRIFGPVFEVELRLRKVELRLVRALKSLARAGLRLRRA